MITICDWCKTMVNPQRIELLRRVYASPDGVNVGVLADELAPLGLGLSGVSQYLRQMERLGILRRERTGLYVNYRGSTQEAIPPIAQATEALVPLLLASDDGEVRGATVLRLTRLFAALMNPLRARIVSEVARAGSLTGAALCRITKHAPPHLNRDLRQAIEAGLLVADHAHVLKATYTYVPPPDAFGRLLVSLMN